MTLCIFGQSFSVVWCNIVEDQTEYTKHLKKKENGFSSQGKSEREESRSATANCELETNSAARHSLLKLANSELRNYVEI